MQIQTRIILWIYVLTATTISYGQQDASTIAKSHVISFRTQFIQIKDAFNYGLVYGGPNLVLGYEFVKETKNYVFSYRPEIAFGGVFNKGAGFTWRFKPVHFMYGLHLRSKPLTIAAYLSTDYQWQQYSELQGGRLFWFSTIEVGPSLTWKLPNKNQRINVHYSNSLMGFSARPAPATESHFYAFSLSEFTSVAHRNLKFGSFNLFNRSKIAIDIQPNTWEKLSVNYGFEHMSYYQEPRITFISHSLALNWEL